MSALKGNANMGMQQAAVLGRRPVTSPGEILKAIGGVDTVVREAKGSGSPKKVQWFQTYIASKMTRAGVQAMTPVALEAARIAHEAYERSA